MDPQHLLIVTNQLSKSDSIHISHIVESIDKIKSIQRIDLLYVQPLIPTHCFALPETVKLLDELQRIAEHTLRYWGEILDVLNRYQWTSYGSLKQEILCLIHRAHSHRILLDRSLSKELRPHWSFADRNIFSLIRNFGSLEFYGILSKEHAPHQTHPVPQTL